MFYQLNLSWGPWPRAKWPLVGWVPGADLKWKQREEGTSEGEKLDKMWVPRGFFFST